jgi:hypothetical protein
LLTIAWGWEGVGAAAGFFAFAGGCLLLWRLIDDRPHGVRDLVRDWRTVLLAFVALCAVVLSIDQLWAAFHVRSTQLTVRGLDVEYDDNDLHKTYYVDATDGRRFMVRKRLYHQLHAGSGVECEETRPLIRRNALLSCAKQAPR